MLGTHTHPDHMLRDMSDEEWQGWLWYMQHEPFGFPALDLWHGMQCAVAIAPHLKPGVRADPTDYMLGRRAEREMSEGETEALLDTIFGVRTHK